VTLAPQPAGPVRRPARSGSTRRHASQACRALQGAVLNLVRGLRDEPGLRMLFICWL
jgi:hypothetical protein